MGMGQFKKRGNAKSPITAVITAVITAREYYREAPCYFSWFNESLLNNPLIPPRALGSLRTVGKFRDRQGSWPS